MNNLPFMSRRFTSKGLASAAANEGLLLFEVVSNCPVEISSARLLDLLLRPTWNSLNEDLFPILTPSA